VKEALHVGMRRVLAIFRSHNQKIDLEVLSEGYVDSPEEELDAIAFGYVNSVGQGARVRT
jgi:hypothetical protein